MACEAFAGYVEIMANDFDAHRAECEQQVREGKQFVDGRWSTLYVGDFLGNLGGVAPGRFLP